MNATGVLKKYFGYDSFRMNQEEAIASVIAKEDAFVLMPTGGGKSLCYQVPALMLEGTAIVISPLIALMKDQVDALRANGIPAAFLNSSQNLSEQQSIIQQVQNRELKLLYLAPERISGNESFFAFLKQLKISLFAIDEAHCISHWGHDFRPDYLVLSELKERMPGVPLLALTASADERTVDDILRQLRIPEAKVYSSSFNRPNIYYYIRPKRRMLDEIVNYARDHKEEAGIVYCLSRSSTEKMAENLRANGLKAEHYHAGMDAYARARIQERFLKDEINIITATIAFGMGIDKSNVRYVIHSDLPKNIESYYQETGRAGRDGLKSEALLFYSPGDVSKLKSFIFNQEDEAQRKLMLKKLDEMSRFAESHSCRRKYLMNYFGEEHPGFCNSCDFCLDSFESVDYTVEAQKWMSAMIRLGERYGKGFIVEFLRGSKNKKISPEQQMLKTYGIGRDRSADDWNNIASQLINLGYIEQTNEQYPKLIMAQKGWTVINAGEKVMIHRMRERSFAVYEDDIEPQYQMDLFERLRGMRRAIAASEGVPPYVILSDATLQEMAAFLPLNEMDLSSIAGFGEFKVNKYGQSFLSVLKSYCEENGLETRMQGKSRKRVRSQAAKPRITSVSTSANESLALFRQGMDIPQIAARRGMSVITIQDHLISLIESGGTRVEEFVDAGKMKVIQKVIEENGAQKLRFYKDILGESFQYSEIRAVFEDIKKNERIQI